MTDPIEPRPTLTRGLPDSRRRSHHWHVFARNTTGVAGAIVVLLVVLAALLAPLFAPYKMEQMNMEERTQPPSRVHWLGTDQFGRDILSRIIFGTRISLLVGVSSVAFAAIIGVGLASTAALYGGWWDDALMRAV